MTPSWSPGQSDALDKTGRWLLATHIASTPGLAVLGLARSRCAIAAGPQTMRRDKWGGMGGR